MQRNAVYLFSVLLLVIIAGFWKTYFSILGEARASYHFHAVIMLLWSAMIIAQAWLIRTGRRDWHRFAGKGSFVLAPLIVWSVLILIHEALHSGDGALNPEKVQGLSVILGSLLQFVIAYSLAIYHRKDSQLHSRFMISASLAIIAAALVRVFLFWIPGFQDFILAEHAKFTVLEVVTLALIFGDWKSGRVRAAYPIFLGLLVLNQLHFVWGYEMSWWRAVAEFMYGWPNLSPWGPPG